MMKMAMILASVMTVSSAAQAVDADYYEIGDVQVTEVKSETLNPRAFTAVAIGSELCGESNGRLFSNNRRRTFSVTGEVVGAEILAPLDVVEMALDKIINIGKKVWGIIEKGKPVVNMRSDVATALPYGAKCWQDLQTWQAPQAKTYAVSYKNLYGMEVVKFNYRVVYVAGGSVNGQGKYIGYAALEPADVSVSWGFNFSAAGSAPTVYNMGTKENPIAGMNLMMNYKITNALKHIESSQSYFINGNGEFQKLD